MVINVGEKKGERRIEKRIGRENKRMEEKRREIMVKENRLEVMECSEEIDENYMGEKDKKKLIEGEMDVMEKNVMGMECEEKLKEDKIYSEVKSEENYEKIKREKLERIIDFVEKGGYEIKKYERFEKIRKKVEGKWRV